MSDIGTGTTGTMLQGGGSGASPKFSTTTYPTTNAVNTLLYASSANVMGALATANSGVLATDGSGVPSITATPTVTSITFGSGTALSSYVQGTWTPTIVGGSVAGSTTYVAQNGYYTRIGNIVYVQGFINISAATGTGDATIGALPFTIKNQTNGYAAGALLLGGSTNWVFPTGYTCLVGIGILNTTTIVIGCMKTASGSSNLQMANGPAQFYFSMTYQI